jgi:hypothetical protein
MLRCCNAAWSNMTTVICGELTRRVRPLALLPERLRWLAMQPVVSLRFTTGYWLSSLRLGMRRVAKQPWPGT